MTSDVVDGLVNGSISESNTTGLFDQLGFFDDDDSILEANGLITLQGNESTAMSYDDEIYCKCKDIGLSHLFAHPGENPECDHFIWNSVQVQMKKNRF